MTSTHARTFVKAVTWETFSFFLTAAVGYWVTGSVAQCSQIAIMLLFMKIACLYVHDRAWKSVKWGKR